MGRILKDAGRVVPGVLLDARAEAEALRAAARREGHAEGRAEAAAEVVATLASARAEAARMLAAARPAALVLAGKMAERIVGRAVALDPAVLEEIAGEALAAARARLGDSVRLRVHPAALPALEPRWARLAARLSEGVTLALEADGAVDRCGCVVETPVGRVDARLDAQIAALERALAGRDGDG